MRNIVTSIKSKWFEIEKGIDQCDICEKDNVKVFTFDEKEDLDVLGSYALIHCLTICVECLRTLMKEVD